MLFGSSGKIQKLKARMTPAPKDTMAAVTKSAAATTLGTRTAIVSNEAVARTYRSKGSKARYVGLAWGGDDSPAATSLKNGLSMNSLWKQAATIRGAPLFR
jgi:hypothetical protein